MLQAESRKALYEVECFNILFITEKHFQLISQQCPDKFVHTWGNWLIKGFEEWIHRLFWNELNRLFLSNINEKNWLNLRQQGRPLQSTAPRLDLVWFFLFWSENLFWTESWLASWWSRSVRRWEAPCEVGQPQTRPRCRRCDAPRTSTSRFCPRNTWKRIKV